MLGANLEDTMEFSSTSIQVKRLARLRCGLVRFYSPIPLLVEEKYMRGLCLDYRVLF